MKHLFVLVCVLGLTSGCDENKYRRGENDEHAKFTKNVVESLNCDWSEKYDVCVCTWSYWKQAGITWAPPHVCGRVEHPPLEPIPEEKPPCCL
jgi:hypothetical protein